MAPVGTRFLPVAAALILLLLAPRASASSPVYAIVIGNNAAPSGDLGVGYRPLRYADDDAARFTQLFQLFAQQTHLFAVLDRETQKRFPQMADLSQPPTLAKLDQTLEQLAERFAEDTARGDDPILYLVYSGHGAIDDQHRAQLSFLDQGLTKEGLLQRLAELQTRYIHLIIDACYAGAVVGVRGAFDNELTGHQVDVTAADVSRLVDRSSLQQLPGLGLLLASSVDQESHEWSGFESGVFSHEVLSGLYGPADINRDGAIEYSELRAFIAAANREVSDPRALPNIIASPPARNHSAVLLHMDTLRDVGMLEGNLSSLGHFHVELVTGQRWLDANLGDQVKTRLVLPAGVKSYIRSGQREASVDAESGQVVTLTQLDMKPASASTKGAVDSAFRIALFRSPYTMTYYKGYVDSVGAVAVRFDQPAMVGPAAEPEPPWFTIFGAGLLGVGGLFAVSCGVAGVLTWFGYNDYSAARYQREAYDANQRILVYGNVTWVAAVVSAVAAGAGAVLLLQADGEERD